MIESFHILFLSLLSCPQSDSSAYSSLFNRAFSSGLAQILDSSHYASAFEKFVTAEKHTFALVLFFLRIWRRRSGAAFWVFVTFLLCLCDFGGLAYSWASKASAPLLVLCSSRSGGF